MSYSIEETWDAVGRADEVVLDGVEGTFLVIGEKMPTPETKIALDVIDEEGVEYRIQKVDLGDTYLRIAEGHDTPVVTNVDSVELIRGIEIVGRDKDRMVDYYKSEYGYV